MGGELGSNVEGEDEHFLDFCCLSEVGERPFSRQRGWEGDRVLPAPDSRSLFTLLSSLELLLAGQWEEGGVTSGELVGGLNFLTTL